MTRTGFDSNSGVLADATTDADEQGVSPRVGFQSVSDLQRDIQCVGHQPESPGVLRPHPYTRAGAVTGTLHSGRPHAIGGCR